MQYTIVHRYSIYFKAETNCDVKLLKQLKLLVMMCLLLDKNYIICFVLSTLLVYLLGLHFMDCAKY